MRFLKRLWPFAKRAVFLTVEIHPQLHPDLVLATQALAMGNVIGALDAIADFVQDDYKKSTYGAVKSLLYSVEKSLRIAANEYEMSLK